MLYFLKKQPQNPQDNLNGKTLTEIPFIDIDSSSAITRENKILDQIIKKLFPDNDSIQNMR